MFSHKQDSHFQAVPVQEKRKKAQKGTLACIRPAPEVKAPSRAANRAPVSSTSPTLWSPRASPAAAPTPPVLSPHSDPGWCRVADGGDGVFWLLFWKIWNANLFQDMLTSLWGPKPRACTCAGPWKVENSLPALSDLVRGSSRPAFPGLTLLSARTPQTGLMLKTSLFFGSFVCFEFIQSLRNLWFWLEI